MFLSFFYLLRSKGIDVSVTEWLTLIEALDKGLCHGSFTEFYYLCRMCLVNRESDYDNFDLAFGEYFKAGDSKMAGQGRKNGYLPVKSGAISV